MFYIVKWGENVSEFSFQFWYKLNDIITSIWAPVSVQLLVIKNKDLGAVKLKYFYILSTFLHFTVSFTYSQKKRIFKEVFYNDIC